MLIECTGPGAIKSRISATVPASSHPSRRRQTISSRTARNRLRASGSVLTPSNADAISHSHTPASCMERSYHHVLACLKADLPSHEPRSVQTDNYSRDPTGATTRLSVASASLGPCTHPRRANLGEVALIGVPLRLKQRRRGQVRGSLASPSNRARRSARTRLQVRRAVAPDSALARAGASFRSRTS